MSGNAAEAIKVASGLASVIGIGFGAYRSIRNDLADVEGRLRSDFREDLRGVEDRLRETIHEVSFGSRKAAEARPRIEGPAEP